MLVCFVKAQAFIANLSGSCCLCVYKLSEHQNSDYILQPRYTCKQPSTKIIYMEMETYVDATLCHGFCYYCPNFKCEKCQGDIRQPMFCNCYKYENKLPCLSRGSSAFCSWHHGAQCMPCLEILLPALTWLMKRSQKGNKRSPKALLVTGKLLTWLQSTLPICICIKTRVACLLHSLMFTAVRK